MEDRASSARRSMLRVRMAARRGTGWKVTMLPQRWNGLSRGNLNVTDMMLSRKERLNRRVPEPDWTISSWIGGVVSNALDLASSRVGRLDRLRRGGTIRAYIGQLRERGASRGFRADLTAAAKHLGRELSKCRLVEAGEATGIGEAEPVGHRGDRPAGTP